jgi:hypothetical protein
MGLWQERIEDGLMAGENRGWAYGTRQYKVDLWHEAVNDGLMVGENRGWAYGRRE